MKNTILAQRLALDFCQNPTSGYNFTLPEARELLVIGIAEFLSVDGSPEDLVAAMELALRLSSGINKRVEPAARVEIIKARAQEILDWEPPKPKPIEKPKVKPFTRKKRGSRKS
jgi:hypothetical protein